MFKGSLPPPKTTTPEDRTKLIAELHRDFSSAGIRRRRHQQYYHQLSTLFFFCTFGCLKRLSDVFAALLLFILVSPVLLLLWGLARSFKGGIIHQERLGRWATIFPQYRFDWGQMPDWFFRSTRITLLPSLLNVLTGHMSFVGPRALAPEEVSASDRAAWKRFDLRPGFVCLWWIRHRAKMAYSSETALDIEYLNNQSFWGDLGIALRAIPASLVSFQKPQAPERLTLLRVPFHNLTMREATEAIVQMAQQGQPKQVCFVNADCVNIALQSTEYTGVLHRASLVLGDGIGIRLAAAFCNQHIRENVNGTDLLPYLCEALQKQKIGIYFLGGRPGVAAAAAAKLQESYPGLQVCGYHHGYFAVEQEQQIIKNIQSSGAGILLVAFGAPRQEIWIARHLNQLGVGVALGVGGLLDFYSGRIPRAPAWMRELGLEWVYRLQQEPKRMWKRYLVGNLVFLFRVLRERAANAGTQGLGLVG